MLKIVIVRNSLLLALCTTIFVNAEEKPQNTTAEIMHFYFKQCLKDRYKEYRKEDGTCGHIVTDDRMFQMYVKETDSKFFITTHIDQRLCAENSTESKKNSTESNLAKKILKTFDAKNFCGCDLDKNTYAKQNQINHWLEACTTISQEQKEEFLCQAMNYSKFSEEDK